MAHNPIQIVLNAQAYVAKAEINPGSTIRDFFAGRDADFVRHRDSIERQVLDLRNAPAAEANNEVFYAHVELQSDAWAKSHRPIKKVFPSSQHVYVGGGDLGSMVVELTLHDITRIAETISQAEAIVEEIEKKGEIKPNPSKSRSEVGAIKAVRRYTSADRRSFSLDDAAQWLSDPRTGGAYYVETFVSHRSIGERPSESLRARGTLALERFVHGFHALNLPVDVTQVSDAWVNASIFVIKISPNVLLDARKARAVHAGLLAYLDSQAVVKSILLPPVLQASRSEGRQADEPLIAPPQDGTSYPIVGIIDTGITSIRSLKAWRVGFSDFLDPIGQDVAHGTFIAGLICAADTMNEDPALREVKCKFFDLGLHPTAAGIYSEYYPRGFIDFLEQLDAELPAAKNAGVRVFNMSLAVTTPVQNHSYSIFANMLDEIADKHDVLIVLPAGNLGEALARDEWPDAPNDALAMLAGYRFQGQDGIFQPADSIRALVVGAVDPLDLNGRYKPSRYTRRGPGPALGIKPDIAHVGGRMHERSGLKSIAPDGAGIESCGTSFAAPLAAKTVAAIDHAIDGGIVREALTALIVHHAEVPEDLDPAALRGVIKDFVGHGVPKLAADTLLLEDHEITMVFNGVIKRAQELKFQFSWPSSLVSEKGGCSGKVRLTLVYKPPIDRAFGGEFVRINLDAYLRQEVINKKTNKSSFKGQLKGDGSKRFEKELVQHGAKWWPVKRFDETFDDLGSSSQWRLIIDPLARTNCVVPEDGIPFSAVLTIASPDKETPIFNEMRLQLQNEGVQISDIRSALRPRVR